MTYLLHGHKSEERIKVLKNAILLHPTTEGQPVLPLLQGRRAAAVPLWAAWVSAGTEKGRGCALSTFEPWWQRADTKGFRAPSAVPFRPAGCQCCNGIHLPRALGREEGLKWPLGPLPGLGVLAGAKRHYGRHSLGLVLFIVSTGLNVSGQLYLHVAEKGYHLQLLQRKQTQGVRC